MGLLDLSGDTATQLRMFNAVEFADISDMENISENLQRWLECRLEWNYMQACENNMNIVRCYSRSSHTKNLGALMDELSLGKDRVRES